MILLLVTDDVAEKQQESRGDLRQFGLSKKSLPALGRKCRFSFEQIAQMEKETLKKLQELQTSIEKIMAKNKTY